MILSALNFNWRPHWAISASGPDTSSGSIIQLLSNRVPAFIYFFRTKKFFTCNQKNFLVQGTTEFRNQINPCIQTYPKGNIRYIFKLSMPWMSKRQTHLFLSFYTLSLGFAFCFFHPFSWSCNLPKLEIWKIHTHIACLIHWSI